MENNNFPILAENSFNAFGTKIIIKVVVENEKSQQKIEETFLEIRRIYQKNEHIFSRFDSESELNGLNSKLGEFQEVSSELLEVAKKILTYNEKTEGLFDARVLKILEQTGYDRDFKSIGESGVKMDSSARVFGRKLEEDILISGNLLAFLVPMDFAGLVKGWTTDQVAKFLLGQGWHNFFVDSGGDLFFAGKDEEGNFWYVDVEGIDYEKMLLQLSEVGVATSGIGKRKWEKVGQRFHHLVNPKDPRNFSFALKSVTVIAINTETADVLAKTIFLLGKEKGMEYARKNEIACIILDSRGTAWISPKLKDFLYIKSNS